MLIRYSVAAAIIEGERSILNVRLRSIIGCVDCIKEVSIMSGEACVSWLVLKSNVV